MINFIGFLYNCPNWIRMAIAFSYLVLIFFLSLSTSPSLFRISPGFPGFDKIAHFLLYGSLAVLLRWVFWNHSFKNVKGAWVLIGIFIYGFLMEIMQALFTNDMRTFGWGDTMANIAGAVIFWILAGRILKK